jgi:DNA-binding response OmpR family regulator
MSIVSAMPFDPKPKKMLQSWLEGEGYKCIVGTTLEDAWQALQDPANIVSVVVTVSRIDGCRNA